MELMELVESDSVKRNGLKELAQHAMYWEIQMGESKSRCILR